MKSLSPAERYALSRQQQRQPRLQEFAAGLSFDLDPFQRAACAALDDGRSVLVAAPTGAGKTVVAEFAVYLAMQSGDQKVFYTTPIKALSNQKYQEFVDTWGARNVGLLTGDTNINSGARIVVMTTEVLRNMLYADSPLLDRLAYVVMDEVHYLADRFRGAVWEEVIIHLPEAVRLVSLSATVSNAEEFGDWLQAVRGETDVIVSEQRPVPLEQHVLVGAKLVDLFDSSGQAATHRVNPELQRLARAGGRSIQGRSQRGRRGSDRGRFHGPGGGLGGGRAERPEVVELLRGKHLLPAIVFIFSRAGCDQAVRQVLRSGIRLTDAVERDEIRAIVEERARMLRDEDLAVLGYWEWLEGLQRGVAAHHAGMLPTFKEVVEDLFQRKLLKVVFATETLALGVNMPARSVVLEKLEKFNGEARVPITPGEYTQLTGRAGRRGIDVEGHSVIQWVDGLDPESVASLASRRSYPLNSSFNPTYNMAVNLVDQFGRERTRQVLELSFAQFQADRAVVDLARTLRKQEESMAGYEQAMRCHLGDFGEYFSIRRRIGELERQQAKGNPTHAQRERMQRELAAERKRLRAHPCHGCAEREQHARWAERWWRLKRDHDDLSRQIRTRTGQVAKRFDRVAEVLQELGYLESDGRGGLASTAAGRTLKRIYGERDLLVAESLRRGLWDRLDVPSIAAMAVALVYEPRRDERGMQFRLPKGPFREAFERTTDAWSELDDVERDHRLPGSEQPSPALASAMHAWARGVGLGAILADTELAAGDFVRLAKQVIDLLDQVSIVAEAELGATARAAIDAVRRGVVAYGAAA
ncbi:ATP-dependent RNA helicase HelY [Agromyces flavus]|uniref:ATP-dependent RNA helicase HelY n=1 Tax=Agromyces flavus TaxID=589382 RepID=A0A1H1RI18_9MICO|nr:DEAD/DEAH box helicase [Agromyces flavus]MCP2368818.1 ATP-dependent RNA helicase HelY [Agromyces flavus]GGI48274.1 helicase [Agromyces flavus]SDS35350.1 ATP-dependent RNA helicase HelY [Agromyces flavus]